MRRAGDVVAIPLGAEMTAFGRVLPEPLVEFYDLCASEMPAVEAIVRHPLAFTVYVMNSAVTSGRWRVVGHVPTAGYQSPTFFKQDPLDPSDIRLYRDGVETPANFAEASGLECAAVWSAEHIEDRLRDHFAGKECQWVLSVSLRTP